MSLDSGPSLAGSVATVEQAKKTQRMLQVLKTKTEQRIQQEQQYEQHMQVLQERERRQKEHRENRQNCWKEEFAQNNGRHQAAHERVQRMDKFIRDYREQQAQHGAERRLRASESIERQRRQQSEVKHFNNLRRAEIHSQRHEEIVQGKREWHEQCVQRHEERHERARGITSAYAREWEEVQRHARKADEFRIHMLQKVGEGRTRDEDLLQEIERMRLEVEHESSLYISSIGGSILGSVEAKHPEQGDASRSPRFRPPARGAGARPPDSLTLEGSEDQTLEQDVIPSQQHYHSAGRGSSPRSVGDSGDSRRRKESRPADSSVYDHLMAVFAQKALCHFLRFFCLQ